MSALKRFFGNVYIRVLQVRTLLRPTDPRLLNSLCVCAFVGLSCVTVLVVYDRWIDIRIRSSSNVCAFLGGCYVRVVSTILTHAIAIRKNEPRAKNWMTAICVDVVYYITKDISVSARSKWDWHSGAWRLGYYDTFRSLSCTFFHF